jgi:alkanesulfonate monooxygenase SsuD/methylene tetrahydromethanopterin reductase-like flavin-dependent oxidoreductase (luciferase family)
MEIGTTLPTGCTGEYAVAPGALREWAAGAEQRGFAGLWTLDHLVKPDTYATSVLNAPVALAHAAGVTDRIPLGTSILLLPLRGAANAADAALSLQHLADRRVTLGLGAGYVPEEFDVTGVPIEERGPRLSEGIEVLQTLFAGEGSYDGRFHSFEGVRMDPVPAEPPRILAGGSSLYTDGGMPEPMLDRIVAADGWIAPPAAPELIEDDWARIREHAERSGVDPDGLDTVMLNYCYVVETDDREAAHDEQAAAFAEFFSPDRGFEHARETCLTGTPADIRDRLGAYEAAGVDQAIAGTPAHTRQDLAEQLDLLAEHVLDPWD